MDQNYSPLDLAGLEKRYLKSEKKHDRFETILFLLITISMAVIATVFYLLIKKQLHG